MDNHSSTPAHVAIIMDGNRRWAKKQGLKAILGHEHVVNNVIEPLVDRCIERGVRFLTLWAFSTENWSRDKEELEGMMQLFRLAFEKKVEALHQKGVRLKILGEIEKFPPDIAKRAKEWVELSKNNTKITVSFALNYGGRDEILRACRSAMDAGIKPEDLDERVFSEFLDTSYMPDPDIIIRPGGQLRLSGFLPWQSVYAELFFSEKLMPEFTPDDFDVVLTEFSGRQRRFGK